MLSGLHSEGGNATSPHHQGTKNPRGNPIIKGIIKEGEANYQSILPRVYTLDPTCKYPWSLRSKHCYVNVHVHCLSHTHSPLPVLELSHMHT